METSPNKGNGKEIERLKNELIAIILATPETSAKILIDTYLAFTGISKRALAKELNLSHTMINRALSGDLKAGKAVDKIFNALGINNPWAS